MPDLFNWWAIRAHLRTITRAQVKPATIQRYLEELQKAQAALDHEITRMHEDRVAARRTQGLPHQPKLEPEAVPVLRIAKATQSPGRSTQVQNDAHRIRQPQVARD